MFRMSFAVSVFVLGACASGMKMETIPAAQEAPSRVESGRAEGARGASARIRDYSKCDRDGLRGEGDAGARGAAVVVVRNDMEYGCVSVIASRAGHSFKQKVARDRDGSDLLPAGATSVIPVSRFEWDGGETVRRTAIGAIAGAALGALVDVFDGRTPFAEDIAEGRFPRAGKTGILGGIVGLASAQIPPDAVEVEVLVRVWDPEGNLTGQEVVRMYVGGRGFYGYGWRSRYYHEKQFVTVYVGGNADEPVIEVGADGFDGRGAYGRRSSPLMDFIRNSPQGRRP